MPGPGIFVLSSKKFLPDDPNFLVKQFYIFELTYLPFGDNSTAWIEYAPGPGLFSWVLTDLPIDLPKSLTQLFLYLAKKYFPFSLMLKVTGYVPGPGMAFLLF